ncbi:MAG: hypothetical protein DMG57_42470 [Acidobacteria bacterium]|nr:MAG: hypothetical protein DMG57_42470 [Acidobacteriota bacterium]
MQAMALPLGYPALWISWTDLHRLVLQTFDLLRQMPAYQGKIQNTEKSVRFWSDSICSLCLVWSGNWICMK